MLKLANYINNFSLRIKIFIVYIISFTVFVIIISFIIYPILQKTIESNIESELNNTTKTILYMVKASVDSSIKNYLRAIAEKNREHVEKSYLLYKNGFLSEQKAKKQVINILLEQTVGKTGYLYCLDNKGIILVHPVKSLIGTSLIQHKFIQEQIKNKEGYLEYEWKNPGETKERPKALYMTYFQPWNWIISVSSYREEFKELINIGDFRENILSIKFGKTGYSYIIDSKGNVIVHPILAGNYYEAKDANGYMFMKDICRIKNGKLIYSWRNPDEKNFNKKLAIFNYIPELDWIIVSSSYVKEFYNPLSVIRLVFFIITIFFLFLFYFLTFGLSSYIIKNINILIEGFKKGGNGDFSINLLKKSNDEFGILTEYFNIFMKKLNDYNYSIQEEITERKQTEEELKRHRDHLEDLVNERTSELNIARELAESANQAKSDFLANMSHELRTPLNSILGYTQILRIKSELNKEQEEAINVIHQSGNYLLTLINDILDIAKIEVKKLTLDIVDFDLSSFLENIVEIVNIKALKKFLNFYYKPSTALPIYVSGAETRLRQVLLNLLGNAIKFTESGEIRLKVSIIKSLSQNRQKIKVIRFEISDTGIGIKPEDIKFLFHPFIQVGSDKYNSEGTGLGLAISQTLITAMGSKIYITSEYGKGSIFWFDLKLPVVKSSDFNNIINDKKIIGYKGNRKKILIVDDRIYNREVLSKLLSILDFEIIEAENGKEALQKVSLTHPDLILMDLRMPIMDGYEAVKKIREEESNNNIIIIAISASVFDKDQFQSYLVGCNDFIRKPVIFKELLAILEKYLKLEWIFNV